MSTTFRIQQANTESGEYDVNKPRPYPLVVKGSDGGFAADDFARRAYNADHLIGFQDGDRQVITLDAKDFEHEPELAVGKCPVFVGTDGKFFALSLPVESVLPIKRIGGE